MLSAFNSNDRTVTFFYDDLAYTTSIEQPPVTAISWGADASGNGNDGGNWTPSIPPNSNTLTATLGSVITAARTVVVDSPMTVKELVFDNTRRYTVAGLGSVNLDADTGNAEITVVRGTHEFQVPISLADNTTVTVPSGVTLSMNGLLDLNGFTLTKTGAGTLNINNIVRDGGSIVNTGSGSLTILGFVPEPSTMLLVMIAGGGVALVRRRR
jgi:hypothetical protein